MQESCAICGMVANVDPSLHVDRYGHTPEVWRVSPTGNEALFRFDFHTFTFRAVPSVENGQVAV